MQTIKRFQSEEIKCVSLEDATRGGDSAEEANNKTNNNNVLPIKETQPIKYVLRNDLNHKTTNYEQILSQNYKQESRQTSPRSSKTNQFVFLSSTSCQSVKFHLKIAYQNKLTMIKFLVTESNRRR